MRVSSPTGLFLEIRFSDFNGIEAKQGRKIL